MVHAVSQKLLGQCSGHSELTLFAVEAAVARLEEFARDLGKSMAVVSGSDPKTRALWERCTRWDLVRWQPGPDHDYGAVRLGGRGKSYVLRLEWGLTSGKSYQYVVLE